MKEPNPNDYRDDDEGQASLSAAKNRYAVHDLAEIVRSHVFHASRPWPDGRQPTMPDWNPGCSCGQPMFWSQWDLHLADQILAAGYAKAETDQQRP